MKLKNNKIGLLIITIILLAMPIVSADGFTYSDSYYEPYIPTVTTIGSVYSCDADDTYFYGMVQGCFARYVLGSQTGTGLYCTAVGDRPSTVLSSTSGYWLWTSTDTIHKISAVNNIDQAHTVSNDVTDIEYVNGYVYGLDPVDHRIHQYIINNTYNATIGSTTYDSSVPGEDFTIYNNQIYIYDAPTGFVYVLEESGNLITYYADIGMPTTTDRITDICRAPTTWYFPSPGDKKVYEVEIDTVNSPMPTRGMTTSIDQRGLNEYGTLNGYCEYAYYLGGNITIDYVWELNGSTHRTGSINTTVHSNTLVDTITEENLTAGNWTLTCNYAGYSDNDQATVLDNVAPEANNIQIINETSSLNCSYDFYDEDGDNISTEEFLWYKNESEILGQTSQTITDLYYDTGDEIRCSVQVKDLYTESSGYKNSSLFLFNDTEAPFIYNELVPTTYTPGIPTTYYVDCLDADGEIATDYPKMSWKNALGERSENFTMNHDSAETYYYRTTYLLETFYWDIEFYCKDGSGNLATLQASNNITFATTSSGGGGGGGWPDDEETTTDTTIDDVTITPETNNGFVEETLTFVEEQVEFGKMFEEATVYAGKVIKGESNASDSFTSNYTTELIIFVVVIGSIIYFATTGGKGIIKGKGKKKTKRKKK